jgi:hypothetical protein
MIFSHAKSAKTTTATEKNRLGTRKCGATRTSGMVVVGNELRLPSLIMVMKTVPMLEIKRNVIHCEGAQKQRQIEARPISPHNEMNGRCCSGSTPFMCVYNRQISGNSCLEGTK